MLGEADLDNFRIAATPDKKRAAEKVLKIDDIDTVDAGTFNQRVAEFEDNEGYDT